MLGFTKALSCPNASWSRTVFGRGSLASGTNPASFDRGSASLSIGATYRRHPTAVHYFFFLHARQLRLGYSPLSACRTQDNESCSLHSLVKYHDQVGCIQLQAGNENFGQAEPPPCDFYDDRLVSCAICGGETGLYIPVCIRCGSRQSCFAPWHLDIGE